MMTNKEAQAVTFEQSEHEAFVCPKDCDRSACEFCVGGLFMCTRCNSFEGATTTHCSGEKIEAARFDLVYAGKMDYRDGEWVEAGSPHTPNRGWDLYLDLNVKSK